VACETLNATEIDALVEKRRDASMSDHMGTSFDPNGISIAAHHPQNTIIAQPPTIRHVLFGAVHVDKQWSVVGSAMLQPTLYSRDGLGRQGEELWLAPSLPLDGNPIAS
jgi:hypothetical protein